MAQRSARRYFWRDAATVDSVAATIRRGADWAKKFGATSEELKTAVAKVGSQAADVESHFKNRKQQQSTSTRKTNRKEYRGKVIDIQLGAKGRQTQKH